MKIVSYDWIIDFGLPWHCVKLNASLDSDFYLSDFYLIDRRRFKRQKRIAERKAKAWVKRYRKAYSNTLKLRPTPRFQSDNL